MDIINKLMYTNTKEELNKLFNPPVKEKHVCFMDYRTCEVHFCTVKISELKENEDEGTYIEHELEEKYGYNSDCYYMSSDEPIKVTMH